LILQKQSEMRLPTGIKQITQTFLKTHLLQHKQQIKQKLKTVRPETVAQASRIQGVTPAAVSQILVHLKKRDLLRKQSA